jgi:peptidoglycan/xylan/chitin deacetylase (PgdA/CDA1 family)
MTSPERSWRVLSYQRVLDLSRFHYPPTSQSFISDKAFVQHIHYLKRKCQVIPLCQLVDMVVSQAKIDPFTVALTFDGGYVEHLTEVAPLLEHVQMPATFFVMPKYLDTALPRWPESIMAFATLCRMENTELIDFPEFNKILKSAGEISGFSNWNHFDQAQNIINHILRHTLERREAAIDILMQPIAQLLTSRIPPTFATKAGLASLNTDLFSIGISGMTGEPMPLLSKEDQASEVLSAQTKLRESSLTSLPYFSFPGGFVDQAMLNGLSQMGITAAFGLDIGSRKATSHRASIPLFPRLALYEEIAPHQVAFVKALWELGND